MKKLDIDTNPRFRAVELQLVAESMLVVLVCGLFAVPLMSLFGRFSILLVLLIPAVIWSTWSRWRTRMARWQLLHDWRQRPVRREGTAVIQEDAEGKRIGRIDSAGHYSVRWERFDAARALYLISQADQTITVSTLDPSAPEILREALRVANYPCEEWPNLDL